MRIPTVQDRLSELENEVLRRAAAYLSPEPAGKMIYSLVRELVALGARVRVPVAVTCRVFKPARPTTGGWSKPATDVGWVQAIWRMRCSMPI